MVGEHLRRTYLRDNVVKPTHLLAKSLFLELRTKEVDPRALLRVTQRGNQRQFGAKTHL